MGLEACSPSVVAALASRGDALAGMQAQMFDLADARGLRHGDDGAGDGSCSPWQGWW